MADDVTPMGGGMPRSFGAKTSFMLGPLLLFLVVGVGISFAILWSFNGKLESKLDAQRVAAEKVEGELRAELKKADDKLEVEKQKVVVLEDQQKQFVKDKAELDKGLKDAIASLETVSTTLQATNTALDNYKKENGEKNSTQDNNINKNERDIKYLTEKVETQFKAITEDINGMKHVDAVLKGEYVALRNDINTTMERGNVTEEELNKLSERSKVFQLRVLTARAKEAEQAAREGDLQKLLVKLNEE